MDYAIFQTGGKQYRVKEGDTIRVESIPGDEGDAIEFDQVLMLSQDGNVSVGAPMVDGARVTAEVVGKGRAKKIIVFNNNSVF